MSIVSVNPATGETIETYEETSREGAAEAVEKADRASISWRKSDFSSRAALMKKAGAILRRRSGEFGRLMALEMGKPISQGVAEAEKCALVCDYYADNAESFLRPEDVKTEAAKSYVAFEPLGAVLAVMPWNFPFWQVFRFAAPALMAGNACLLKHASNVPGCAVAIEGIFMEAGFPEGLFQTLLIGSSDVAPLIEDPLVRAVTLTGSVPAGKAVAAKAGECLKKTVMELGGSDPYVILEDADLEEAAKACAFSRLINSGQSCIAAKRFIVVREVREIFEKLLAGEMSRAVVGDPMDNGTAVGPMARMDLRDELHRQVTDTKDMGADCLLGGEVPPGPGAYYPPTVLSGVKMGMPAYHEELFGPVAAVIEAGGEDEAVSIANDSVFGLGAAVFTGDSARGEDLAKSLESGNCFINTFVRSDPRLPFGGVKESGYGRELSSFGIREFVNIKAVYVK